MSLTNNQNGQNDHQNNKINNNLAEKYNHLESEKKWQKYWQENQIYAWKNDKNRQETFVIDTPPPTVSGFLHMGHIFSYCQADFIARFQRMIGKDVFYPIGFDDNGLPTERLVEKIIDKKATIFEAENGNGSFVKKCREVIIDAEAEFENLFNAIALSVDWKQKYQTISPESQKISQASFIDLFNKKLVERKFEPIFWDYVDKTALAQADLVDKEVDSSMNDIIFNIENSDENIIIMTTRPELMASCVAVMVHPSDSRYQHLHNKYAITPLFKIRVPIIADDLVQIDKGTGAVMCCTFGDETDIKWWKKHNLATRITFAANGLMMDIDTNNDSKDIKFKISDTKQAVETIIDSSSILAKQEFINNYQQYIANKKIKEANKSIIAALNSQQILIKSTPIKHIVKTAERSGVAIEIILTNQWFIKILDKKEELKNKANSCNWHPEYMKIRLEQWIDNLAWDWCISRQRFFGVKFPIWFSQRKGEEGKILIAEISQLPVDPNIDLPIDKDNKNGNGFYDREEIIAETDIMDTWATSSISPQLSSKGISDDIKFDDDRHSKLFPADLRPQAHEIIRTWAFYTLVKSHLHQNSIAWSNLMISGWCLAADKTKMSKSKGNIITPTALINEKSSDVVRYWAANSHLGADTAYSEEVFKVGQKLITKLFNAAKFCTLNSYIIDEDIDLMGYNSYKEGEDFQLMQSLNNEILLSLVSEVSDLWIITAINQTIINATKELNNFAYGKAREIIEKFFWQDFCDNYLEICKVRVYGKNAEKYSNIKLSGDEEQEITKSQKSALVTLKICLNSLLKLFAPFIPHICEEIYANIFSQEFAITKSINARGNWANIDLAINKKFNKILQETAIQAGSLIIDALFYIRKIKSENNLSLKTTIKQLIINKEYIIANYNNENVKFDNKILQQINNDLANVGNVAEILISDDFQINQAENQESLSSSQSWLKIVI